MAHNHWLIGTSEPSEATVLVAAALVERRHDRLRQAEAVARSTRDRQLVAIAAAHLAGDADRVDALARDHLADYPDNVLVARIAATSRTGKEKP
jgi:glutamine synthetase adenylyltransferase